MRSSVWSLAWKPDSESSGYCTDVSNVFPTIRSKTLNSNRALSVRPLSHFPDGHFRTVFCSAALKLWDLLYFEVLSDQTLFITPRTSSVHVGDVVFDVADLMGHVLRHMHVNTSDFFSDCHAAHNYQVQSILCFSTHFEHLSTTKIRRIALQNCGPKTTSASVVYCPDYVLHVQYYMTVHGTVMQFSSYICISKFAAQ